MASRYGPKAQKKVARAMRERKRGTLKSGGSGKRVTSRKQAIAIGLSEARREGAKVPGKPARRRRAKAAKTGTQSRRSTARRPSATRRSTAKRTTKRKTSRRRRSSRG